MQSAVNKEELRMRTVELTVVESQMIEQDTHVRRMLPDSDSLAKRLATLTDISQQGTSLRDDQYMRIRRYLVEAIERAKRNKDMRSLRNVAQRALSYGLRQLGCTRESV